MRYVLPALVTILLWWISTGTILLLVRRPRRTFRWTFAMSIVLLIAALTGLYATRNDASVTGAYLAFGCASLVWAWQEIGFLLGYVTGTRDPRAPPARGFPRLVSAFRAVLHHELALLALGVLIAAALADARNRTGLWTYLIFWAMRVSAEINVFLGVRNLFQEFLPAHLTSLARYFRQRSMNMLFPFSFAAAVGTSILLWQAAWNDGNPAFDIAQISLLATLASLGALEHLLLMLPVSASSLWQWALKASR